MRPATSTSRGSSMGPCISSTRTVDSPARCEGPPSSGPRRCGATGHHVVMNDGAATFVSCVYQCVEAGTVLSRYDSSGKLLSSTTLPMLAMPAVAPDGDSVLTGTFRGELDLGVNALTSDV